MAQKLGVLHETLHRHDAVKGPSDKRFGLTFAAVFTLIALLALWRSAPHAPYWLAAAALCAALALLRPAALAIPNRAWLKLGLALHALVSPLIMGLMFFLVFTPLALLIRLRGKDLLRLRRDPEAPSYWIPRQPPGPAPDTLKQQF